MRKLFKSLLVLAFVAGSINLKAQNQKIFELEYIPTTRVENFVDTIYQVCVLFENIDFNKVEKVLVKTSSKEFNSGKSSFSITEFGNLNSENKPKQCLGLFNVTAENFNVSVKIYDKNGESYKLLNKYEY